MYKSTLISCMKIMDTIKLVYSDDMRISSTGSDINSDVGGKPKIVIHEGDMFEYALNQYKLHKVVTIHNFANNDKAGLYTKNSTGDHVFMTNTQEEQLLRSSLVIRKERLRVWLPIELYPICDGNNACLSTKSVKFYADRCKSWTNYKDKPTVLLEDKHYIADVVTAPAISRPQVRNNKYVHDCDRQDTLNRMILVIHASKDSDVLITGLWGCGAFMHPIREVINLWKTAINLSKHFPKEIVFVYYVDTFTNTNDPTVNSQTLHQILLS